MVLKLKLKVPSGGGQSSGGVAEEAGLELPRLAKTNLKLLRPKDPNKVQKRREKREKREKSGDVGEEKHRKLKFNLTAKVLPPPVSQGGGELEEMVEMSKPGKVRNVRIKPPRIPGEGYDSEAPDLEDDPLMEQAVVVRFLDDANLDFVHNAADSGDFTGLNIKWVSKDKAVVNVSGTLYSARLVDLPTITEFYKTIDKKNLFKTVDVCQILLVLKVVNPNELNMDRDFEIAREKTFTHPLYDLSSNRELKPSKDVYADGLLYPFTNIHRRFKPRKFNHRVMQDVQQKVDELIRLDDEAEESHFEILDLKQNKQGYNNLSRTPSAVLTPTAMGPSYDVSYMETNQTELDTTDNNVDIHVDDGDLEQELAKALEDDETLVENMKVQADDGDVYIGADVVADSYVDGEEIEEDADEGDEKDDDDEDDDDEDDEDDDEDDDDDDEDDDDDNEEENDEDENLKEEKQHAKMLAEEIADLENAVEVHRRGLASATHKMMKMKFQTSYNTLKATLENKKRELSKLVGDQKNSRSGLSSAADKPDSNAGNNEQSAKDSQPNQSDSQPEDEDDIDHDNLGDIDDLF